MSAHQIKGTRSRGTLSRHTGVNKRTAEDADLSDRDETTKKLPHIDSDEPEDGEILRHTDNKQDHDLSDRHIKDDKRSATLDGPIPEKEQGSEASEPSSLSRVGSPVMPDSPLQSVMNPRLQEIDLVDSYANLPPLKSAIIRSSNSNDDDSTIGFFKFDLWRELISASRDVMKKIKDAITFSAHDIYFNPSRAAPSYVGVGEIKISSNLNHGIYIVSPALKTSCMMAVITDRSSISKRLTLLPHSQEFERYVAFLGTVFGTRSILAPCFHNSSLSFSTRISDMASPPRKAATGLGLQSFLNRNLSAAPASPAVAGPGLGRVKYVRTSLGAHDNVPIYDATAGNFVLSEDINDVAGLPLYKQGKTDLPDGSCVTVGHTIGMYKNKEGQSTLTLNIHWVIVWGCPS